MGRKGLLVLAAFGLLMLASAVAFAWGWWGPSEIDEDTAFVVPSGASVTSVAHRLEEDGLVAAAESSPLRARVLGSGGPIKAGAFLLPAGASPATVLETFQHGEVIPRFVTMPE